MRGIGRRVWRQALLAGIVAAFTAISVLTPAPARADDPAFVSFAGGYFDWLDREDPAAEFRLEYRAADKYWIFKPLGGVMATTDGAYFIYAGVGVDIYFGDRFVVTPSLAPGYYGRGGGLDLGYELEFRSQIELAWRFDDRSRLGLAVSHMSNFSLDDYNPGTESAMLYYSVPIPVLFGK